MANVAICMAMAMMYTVLLTRLGSNSLYRSTNGSCLQGRQGRFAASAASAWSPGSAWPRLSQADICKCTLLPSPTSHHRDTASSGCSLHPLLGQHSLLRAPGLGLPVQVDETQEVHAELEQDREDGIQVEDIGQGPLSRQGLEGLQRWGCV